MSADDFYIGSFWLLFLFTCFAFECEKDSKKVVFIPIMICLDILYVIAVVAAVRHGQFLAH